MAKQYKKTTIGALERLYNSKHKQFGDELRRMMVARAELMQAMDADKGLALAERYLSQKDIFHFIENHVWIYEPRPSVINLMGLNVHTIPMKLFDYQREAIKQLVEKIEKGEDLLIEKSRDMGVSWLVLIVFTWFWLKDEGGNDFLVGSRKFEYVDKKGARDTLFEKIRFVLYHLHPAILPPGYSKLKHDNVGMLLNPYSGSYFRGEANNANFGTSGRYKAILADEFAKWEETDDPAWTSMGDSSPCRIVVSTPWGMGTKFAQLRFSGAIDVLTLHWSKHPFKAIGLYEEKETGKLRSYWYDLEYERRKDNPDANIAQELDIDYLQSGTPFFDNRIIGKRLVALQENPPKVVRYGWRRIKDKTEEKVEIFRHPAGEIFIHEPPEYPNHWQYRYVISADVAQGLEKGDESVFYVYDRVKRKDVAWFSGKITTDSFALLLITMARWYYNAYIAPETNNNGHAVIQKMKPLYYRIYRRQQFELEYDIETQKLGWQTNNVSRPIMLSQLRELIEDGEDGILDEKFFKQALTFIYNKTGKPEAASGKLDDCVMTQAIKFQAHQWLPAPKESPSALRDVDSDYGEIAPNEHESEPIQYVEEPEGWI